MTFSMSACFGDFLRDKLCGACKRAFDPKHSKAEMLYKAGLALKTGDGIERNMRDAYKMFKEASESGHKGAIAELKECYVTGRGCEKDLTKVADLGDSKIALELGKEMENEGKRKESVKYYWIASDGGEAEATSRLIDIYKEGVIVEEDKKESERLQRLMVTQYQKTEDDLEWRMNKEMDAIFFRGVGKMDDYPPHNPSWRKYGGNIQSVFIEDGIKTIGKDAFSWFKKLTNISISPSVTSISLDSMAKCTRLSHIHVSIDNPNYSSDDGVLFNKEKTFLVYCPKAKSGEYRIPDGVVSIEDSAFSECIHLTSVIFPDSITKIGMLAFENCINLESVKLPKVVQSIGHWAFVNCTKLQTIHMGTVESMGKGIFDKVQRPSFTGKANRKTKKHEYSVEEIIKADSIRALNLYKRVKQLALDSQNDDSVQCLIYEGSVDEKERSELFMIFSKIVVRQSTGIEWQEEGELEWGFDEETGRLIIKGKGSIDDYFYGKKSCQITDYGDGNRKAPWVEKYGDEIRSAIICYGISSIGECAFFNCDNLQSVLIPEGVIRLGYAALFSCNSITRFYIPSSVSLIDENPYPGCLKNLTKICRDNKDFTIVDGALFNKDLTRLISCHVTKGGTYNIPDTVNEICCDAFRRCSMCTEIKIPDSVTKIGSGAFHECLHLTAITIPASVTSIGSNPFSFCRNLASIQVVKSNPAYMSDDGVLFDKNKTKIIAYPPGKSGSYTTPKTVTTVCFLAFCGCSTLKSVTINEGSKSVEKYAFYKCMNMKTVKLPKSIQIVDDDAIYKCQSLKFV